MSRAEERIGAENQLTYYVRFVLGVKDDEATEACLRLIADNGKTNSSVLEGVSNLLKRLLAIKKERLTDSLTKELPG